MLCLVLLLLLHFCEVGSLPVLFRYVTFGDLVTLPCGGSCQDRVNCSLIFEGHEGRTNNRTVSGNVALTQFYENRVQRSDDGSSINITRAEYHDKGVYVWTCDGEIIAEIKLEVWIPTEVSAAEGDDATVNCFIDTDEKSVRWQMLFNGTLVDLPRRTGRSFTHGKAGHFTLTLSAIQPADQGTYVCTGVDSRGKPDAVRVKVTKEATPGIESPTSSTPASWVVASVSLAMHFVCVCGVCVCVRLGGNLPGCILGVIYWIQGRPKTEASNASDQIRVSDIDTVEKDRLSASIPITVPLMEEKEDFSIVNTHWG